MRTWWIVRGTAAAIITEWRPVGWNSAIGPYFSYKEAMEVLYLWTK